MPEHDDPPMIPSGREAPREADRSTGGDAGPRHEPNPDDYGVSPGYRKRSTMGRILTILVVIAVISGLLLLVRAFYS